MPGCKSPRHAQNPLLGEWRKTLATTLPLTSSSVYHSSHHRTALFYRLQCHSNDLSHIGWIALCIFVVVPNTSTSTLELLFLPRPLPALPIVCFLVIGFCLGGLVTGVALAVLSRAACTFRSRSSFWARLSVCWSNSPDSFIGDDFNSSIEIRLIFFFINSSSVLSWPPILWGSSTKRCIKHLRSF